ncbi:MAG: HAMP domain-containing histidine kinase, partial [Proteobacteria bacterium]|nr:HAMP domain-containing histidine kinase [Pseudomonadota bacterium]
MITAALIFSAILIPFVSVVFLRLYENQLVRQAEGEIIGQAAILAATYERVIAAAPSGAFPVGPERPPHDPAVSEDERYTPIVPALDLTSSPILRPRPPADIAATPASAAAVHAGEALSGITQSAQRTTLAGFRLLDANGVVIAGRGDIGLSFAHVPEVRAAMGGRFSAVMRQRDEEIPQPPLYSISRGTNVRVFVAMPVFVDGRVGGVVYASRTPDNILRQLYQERFKVGAAALMVLAASSLIGVAFVRTIARPIRELANRAEAITQNGREAIGPLRTHGTQELYGLSRSLMTMAKRLSDRSEYLSTFANHVSHELKTPLTSLRGAAELMRDGGASMTPEESRRFLSNMLVDVERMTVLLDQLRELARADNPRLGGRVALSDIVSALRQRFPVLQVDFAGDDVVLSMSPENGVILFGHLFENAVNHDSHRMAIGAAPDGAFVRVTVADDGTGVSPGNRDRIFDPFFTTRRSEGGTGMGLGIVNALVRAHG